MPSCSSCGSEIPDGQGSSCSMCYGDVGHGSDGYYQAYMEEWERQEHEKEREAVERRAMQPADFYQGKEAALIEIKRKLEDIITIADKRWRYEIEVADSPDTYAYIKLIERLKKAKMALDFPLGNVERKMNE